MIFLHRRRKERSQKDSGYEPCALCQKPTNIRKDTPIDVREHYVSGVGQLCESCYLKTYCRSNK